MATKFGIVRGPDGVTLDGRPEHVRGYCEASLRRLGRDVIDLYYLHRVDPAVPVADTVGAMAELVREGKVRYLGLSEATPEQLAQAAAVHPIAAVQFEWSLLWRDPEDGIVPAARRLGIGLVPYSPLGRGLLTATLTSADIASSDFRRSDPRFSGGALDRNLAQVAALREVAGGLGITPGQLALAWLLAQGGDVVPIPGSRHPARIARERRRRRDPAQPGRPGPAGGRGARGGLGRGPAVVRRPGDYPQPGLLGLGPAGLRYRRLRPPRRRPLPGSALAWLAAVGAKGPAVALRVADREVAGAVVGVVQRHDDLGAGLRGPVE